MLKDRRKLVEVRSEEARRFKKSVQHYADFLATHFQLNDWFVTITFRDRHKSLELVEKRVDDSSERLVKERSRGSVAPRNSGLTVCAPDPRIQAWEPSSRFHREPGPPVRDAALREITHFLLEVGWEAAGRKRQEIFEWLADRKSLEERKYLAKKLAGNCLCCGLLTTGEYASRFKELEEVATTAIGWVIAEEFGRLGGRWHVHLLIRGVSHLRRKRCWRRAFVRFGRARIEPIHE